MLSNCSVKKMQGWNFANTLTFAFMYHPYLVYKLFGMPSLHLFTFLMFFIAFYFLLSILFLVLQQGLSLRRVTTSPKLETV